jgi:hypothetical protein
VTTIGRGEPLIVVTHNVDLEALVVQISRQLGEELKRLGVHREIRFGVCLWDGGPRTYYCNTPGTEREFEIAMRHVLAHFNRPRLGG